MPTYLHPGVYVEEIASGSRPIEAVGTSTAAFIGYVERGPLNEPTLITSWQEYLRRFGELRETESSVAGRTDPIVDPMGLGIYAFFQNGGKRTYVMRIAAGDPAAASAQLPEEPGDADISFTVVNPGTWGNNLTVRSTPIPGDTNTNHFRLAVGWGAGEDFEEVERFDISLLEEDVEVSFIEHAINGVSELITVELGDDVAGARTELAVGTAAAPLEITMAGGTNGNAPATAEYQVALARLTRVADVNILLVPDQPWGTDAQRAIVEQAVAHCEATRNRMVIIDPNPATELANAAAITALGLPTSTYAVLYYPWVRVANPLYDADRNPGAARNVLVAPGAFAAGLWAKTDARRGVWKAPAGVETPLLGAAGLTEDVGDAEQDFLNPAGVNAIRILPGYGTAVWGARTRATRANPEWRYVPVRRTAIFIEQSLYNGIQWAVFEPNDHRLWSSLRTNVGSFMDGLFRSGAFQGEKVSDAYFVRCGLGSTMTQDDIDRGQVIVLVGFAPLKPAEFVIVRIQQKVGQSS